MKYCKTSDEIIKFVENAEENDIILINNGVYEFVGSHKVVFKNKRNVTLRSVSGNADDVIFKGGGFHKKDGYLKTQIDEPICILSNNDGIIINGITIRDSNCHGIKIAGEGNNANITIENCKFIDICERMIKGSMGDDNYFVNNIKIKNNYFEDTQIPVESDHMENFEGDYIAGIDMMVLNGALISDNKFVNIKGKNHGARGAIFIWSGSSNIIAERNVILNCDRGICFGNPGNVSVGRGNAMFFVNGGVIKNNFINEPASHGIEIAYTNNIEVLNNIIIRSDENGRGISETTINEQKISKNLIIKNNIVRGKIDAKMAEVKNNLTGKPELENFDNIFNYFNFKENKYDRI